MCPLFFKAHLLFLEILLLFQKQKYGKIFQRTHTHTIIHQTLRLLYCNINEVSIRSWRLAFCVSPNECFKRENTLSAAAEYGCRTKTFEAAIDQWERDEAWLRHWGITIRFFRTRGRGHFHMCWVNYIPLRFHTHRSALARARNPRIASAYPMPIIPGIILIPRGTYYSQNYSRIIDAGLFRGPSERE